MIPLTNYDYSEVAVRSLQFTQNPLGHNLQAVTGTCKK